jgi:4-hydroxy-tetrahydrodipicolinate synthase
MARIDPIRFTTRDGRACIVRSAEPADAAEYLAHLRRDASSDPNALSTAAERARMTPDEHAENIRETLDHPSRLMLVAELALADPPPREGASRRGEVGEVVHPPPPSPRIVATLILRVVSRVRLHHIGELGLGVDDDVRGLGVGSAMIRAVLGFAATHPTLERIDLGVYRTNTAARRLYRRLGFRAYARIPAYFKQAEGHYVDDVKMAIWVKPGLAPPGFNVYASASNPSPGEGTEEGWNAPTDHERASGQRWISHARPHQSPIPGTSAMPTVAPFKDPRFTGAFTAIITPFTADGSKIDFGRLDEQIAFQARGHENAGGVRGVVLSGTTGESPTLEEPEYRELLERGVAMARKHQLLAIAGTGSNSTHHSQHLAKIAKAAGADASLSVNPYYNKPTQEGLYRHFMTLADATDLPIMLYNIPGRTGVALTPATIQRLNAHPHIVANKEATGSTDSASEIAMRCPGLALLSGDDSMTLPFASLGGVGVVSVLSNILPTKVAGLCRAFLKGQWDIALNYHRDLFDLGRAMFLETNPIPIKAAMKLLGRDNGVMRLPMCEPGPSTLDAVKKALAQAGLL